MISLGPTPVCVPSVTVEGNSFRMKDVIDK